MKLIIPTLAFVSLFSLVMNAGAETKKKNVLFLAIDDLNDWIGCLAGILKSRPLTLTGLRQPCLPTPNPVCNPSRTSVMLGLRPPTTGIYSLQPSFKKVPKYAMCYDFPRRSNSTVMPLRQDLSRSSAQRRI